MSRKQQTTPPIEQEPVPEQEQETQPVPDYLKGVDYREFQDASGQLRREFF